MLIDVDTSADLTIIASLAGFALLVLAVVLLRITRHRSIERRRDAAAEFALSPEHDQVLRSALTTGFNTPIPSRVAVRSMVGERHNPGPGADPSRIPPSTRRS